MGVCFVKSEKAYIKKKQNIYYISSVKKYLFRNFYLAFLYSNKKKKSALYVLSPHVPIHDQT